MSDWHTDKIAEMTGLLLGKDNEIAQLRSRIAELEGARRWRCFFCDEVFEDEKKAALHFGAEQMASIHSKPSDKPACTFTVEYVRDLELQLDRYRNEDSDLDRKLYAMEAEHPVALRREEEKGYARGLRGAAKELEGARAEVEALELKHQGAVSVCDNWHNWAVEIVGNEAARKMSGQDMRDEILRRLSDRAPAQAEPQPERTPR